MRSLCLSRSCPKELMENYPVPKKKKTTNSIGEITFSCAGVLTAQVIRKTSPLGIHWLRYITPTKRTRHSPAPRPLTLHEQEHRDRTTAPGRRLQAGWSFVFLSALIKIQNISWNPKGRIGANIHGTDLSDRHCLMSLLNVKCALLFLPPTTRNSSGIYNRRYPLDVMFKTQQNPFLYPCPSVVSPKETWTGTEESVWYVLTIAKLLHSRSKRKRVVEVFFFFSSKLQNALVETWSHEFSRQSGFARTEWVTVMDWLYPTLVSPSLPLWQTCTFPVKQTRSTRLFIRPFWAATKRCIKKL